MFHLKVRRLRGLLVAALLSGLAPLPGASQAVAATGLTWERVSTSATQESGGISIASDGSVVAFQSRGAQVPGDTNGQYDCYVATAPSWGLELASVSSTGAVLDSGAMFPRLSADGSLIAFTAYDDDVMVPNTVNGIGQAYVRNLGTGTMERASVNGAVVPTTAGMDGTDLSGDGSRVAMQSDDDAFFTGDNDSVKNIYVRVRGASPTTTLANGVRNGSSLNLKLSYSGMRGVFLTYASDIGTDLNGAADIALWRDGVGVSLVSAVGGVAGNGNSGDYGYAIDDDGTTVVFGSSASNLVAGDSNAKADVFIWRDGSSLERLLVGAGETQGNGTSSVFDISGDGRFVLYTTASTNAPDGPGVYLRDLLAASPRYLCASAGEGQLGAGGDFVALGTTEALDPGDDNALRDVYVTRADFTAPVTIASVESSYNAGGGPVINASDENPVTVYWRYGGGATQSAPAPATAVQSEAGTSTLTYWGVDSEGNTEKPKTAQVVVGDTRAPDCEAVGVQSSYDGTATISLVATDQAIGTGRSGVKRIEWWTDSGLLGGDIWASSGQAVIPYIGERTLYFRAEDNRGNVSSTQSVQFTVRDIDGPALSFGGSADGRFNDIAHIWVTADDGWYGGRLAEVEYSHDGVLWHKVTEDPFGSDESRWQVYAPSTGLGAHVLYARAKDMAGNSSGQSVYAYEIYDEIEPSSDLELVDGPAKQGDQVRLVAWDEGESPSGIKRIHWTYNGGEAQSVDATSVLVTVTDYGTNYFTIWAEDNAGNLQYPVDKNPWVGDGVAPSVELTINATGTRADFSATDPSPGHEGNLLLRWTIDDDPGVNQVEVTNGGSAWQDFSTEGTRTIRVWAMDAAGNEGETRTATFWCDAGGGEDPGGGDPPAGSFQIAAGSEWFNIHVLPIRSNVTGAIQMRFWLPGDAAWRDWVDYSADVTLTADPAQPDGEWRVFAQYRDSTDESAAVMDAEATIGVDRVAPTTTSNASEGRNFDFGEEIVLVADDDRSGPETLWSRVSGGEQVEGDVVLLDPGVHRFEWWAVDVAGNVEEANVETVTVIGPRLLPTSKSATISYGGTYYLTGRVTADLPDEVRPLYGGDLLVMLQYYSGGTWIDTSVTDTPGVDGYFSLPAKPTSKTSYRARLAVAGEPRHFYSTSVVVTPKVSLSTPVAPSTMYAGRAKTVYGYLKPRHTSGTYPVRIYKYRYVSGKWKSYGYVKAKASNYSSYTKYAASVKLSYRGKWRVRAYHPADSGHPAQWSSKYDYVTVK